MLKIKKLWAFPVLVFLAALILVSYPFVKLFTVIDNYIDSKGK